MVETVAVRESPGFLPMILRLLSDSLRGVIEKGLSPFLHCRDLLWNIRTHKLESRTTE